MYIFWLVLSIIALVLGFGITYTIYKKTLKNDKSMRLVNGFVISTFVSAIFMFIPLHYLDYFESTKGMVGSKSDLLVGLQTVCRSAVSTIRMFIVENDLSFITSAVKKMPKEIGLMYTSLAALLAVLAPILTFSVVVAFIKNASASLSIVRTYNKDYYIFSELSNKSIALADSIKKAHPKCKIFFTDVFESNTEASYNLSQQAKTIGATCFKKDIRYIRYNAHSKKSKLVFFIIGEDEAENIRQVVDLIKDYKNRDNTEMYVFSSKCEGDMILSSIGKGKIKVRRVYDYSAMINKYLFDNGHLLFDEASDLIGQNGNKKINAIIVGTGSYGYEMTKALTWYCQMDGYDVTIDVFDKKKNVRDKLVVDCPELIDEKHNGQSDINDARYTINIHEGVDVDSSAFVHGIEEISCPTFVLVSLGNDSENIRVASYLRMMFERNSTHPRILSVVYDGSLSERLKDTRNFAGQSYDIDYIGALSEVYSEDTVMNSELEKKGLDIHKNVYGGKESDFWDYEYNYNSSIAAAIHNRAKYHLGLIKKEEDNVEELKKNDDRLARIEHARWNAYTRSIGYVFSGSTNKESRNHLAKMHHDLVPYEQLDEDEKQKDRVVIDTI